MTDLNRRPTVYKTACGHPTTSDDVPFTPVLLAFRQGGQARRPAQSTLILRRRVAIRVAIFLHRIAPAMAESRASMGRQDEVHTAHTGNRSGEARAAAAGTRGHAVGDRLLHRPGDEMPARQVVKRPLRSRQAQATGADTGAEW